MPANHAKRPGRRFRSGICDVEDAKGEPGESEHRLTARRRQPPRPATGGANRLSADAASGRVYMKRPGIGADQRPASPMDLGKVA